MSLVARIARTALTRPDGHAYGDDPSQVADLHVPAGDGPFPVAVLLHGGFWQTRYGKLVMRPVARDLARRGWVAWNLEYRRLGGGRGGGGGWPMTFDDVARGVDALASLGDPRLDLGRAVVVGHSAGGHLALWAASRPEPAYAFRGVAALASVTNLAKSGPVARRLVGGSPDEVPDRYDLADPIRGVPLDAPVLLVHPADDATVPAKRSREYAAAAEAAGGEVTLIEPPAGGHRSVIHPGLEPWDRTVGWLERRIAVPA